MVRRWIRRAAPPSADRASVAAITVVRDEAVMLPRWLRHYSTQLGGPEHLHVIDDQSSDGSTDRLPCNVSPLPGVKDGGFERARMQAVNRLAARLLTSYDAVLLADADEFLVADPRRHADLRALVAARPGRTALGVVALNVVHHVGVEPPLDPDRSVLDQRELAVFVRHLCKPSVKLEAARWRSASHGLTAAYDVDPELFMFHLKFADRDLLHAAGEHRRAMVQLDGRTGQTSSWSKGGDDLVSLLEARTRDLHVAGLEAFEPSTRRLRGIVARGDNGIWKATGRTQVKAMQLAPVWRIPARFRGIV